jgi:predicted nucleic acid-binding protein
VNGDRLLLDTNAIIYFLEGRSRIAEYILLAETLYYSVITEIELLSAPHLTNDDATVIREFLARCQRVDLTPDIIEQTIHIRRAVRCKTPDAIVAASALILDIPLFTADTQFDRITGLNLVTDILE